MRININEEEVRHILKMHSKEREKTIKKIISEAGPYEDEEIPVSTTATNVTPVSTTATNVTPGSTTATNVTPGSTTATNATFVSNKAMQNWLNINKQSGSVLDNRIGPKTIDAINKALGITTQQTTQQTTTALEPVKDETSTPGEDATQV